MISISKIRLGALACPVAVNAGSGATPSFGEGTGVSWMDQRHQSVLRVRTIDLAPPFVAYNSTSVSAPPERSP